MTMRYPSDEFEDAVAAVCHGFASPAQVLRLNELLRTNPAARDEYILQLELHSRLASDPELFLSTAADRLKNSNEPKKIPPARSDPGHNGN